MTAALIVLAAVLLWVSALATLSLNRMVDRTMDGRAEERAAWRAETDEMTGLLAEELTANRAAHEDTLRMVLAGYERLVYPTMTEPAHPVGVNTNGEVMFSDGQTAAQHGTVSRPSMPGADDPAVTGDLSNVIAEEPDFLGMPLDAIPDDELHVARVEAMYSAPVEPMPEAAGPAGAVMMDVDDPDPFGIGADRGNE